jgi:hypothetical protein
MILNFIFSRILFMRRTGSEYHMSESLAKPCTAFEGRRSLASGPQTEVALAVKNAAERGSAEPILVFDDATGRVIDFDLRGSKQDVLARLSAARAEQATSQGMPAPTGSSQAPVTESRGRGRPKLGVVGREVTLLPRQWEWLAAQPGGASVVLRRLVDEAKRATAPAQKIRASQEAAYHFMSAMAGNLRGFEEATRALFANDRGRFDQQVSTWPEDIRAYATRLAFGAPAGVAPGR